MDEMGREKGKSHVLFVREAKPNSRNAIKKNCLKERDLLQLTFVYLFTLKMMIEHLWMG